MRKSLIVMGALLLALLGGWYHHQHHHFNPNTYISQVDVSGLTTESALKKLEKVKINNQLYVDNQLIYQGKNLIPVLLQAIVIILSNCLKSKRLFSLTIKLKSFTYLLCKKTLNVTRN